MNASTATPSVKSDQKENSLLRRALRVNALFTGVSSLILILAARPLADLFGLPAPLAFALVGVGLLGYAALLWLGASRQPLDPRLGLLAAVLDALWVVGSVAELALGWPPMSVAGKWITAMVADVVGLFAIVQFYAWWRMHRRS